MDRYDAIVVGGGHNGLVNGAYLAQAGLRTLILERRPMVGGAAITEELRPGFQFTTFSYALSLLRPQIIHELELTKHGFLPLLMSTRFAPGEDGEYLLFNRDHDETLREIARLSPHDADAYEQYSHDLDRVCQAIKPLFDMVPPDLFSDDPEELLGTRGARLTAAGPREARPCTTRCDCSPAAPPTSSTTTSSPSCSRATWPPRRSSAPRWDRARRDRVWCSCSIPWASTTASSAAGPSTRAATAASPRCWPARPRRSAPRSGSRRRSSACSTRDGEATGVALADGTEIAADVVVSALDPRRTFLELLEPRELPDDLVEDIRRLKFRGVSSKVNFALDALPSHPVLGARPDLYRGFMNIGPSMDYLERAFDDAKYGWYSEHPYIDCAIQSTIDPDMAPPGKHVLSCFVQYTPYELRESDWDTQREPMADRVQATLEHHFPGFGELVLQREVQTPLDIERTVGLSEGNIFAGEFLAPQMFFFRPAPGWSQYRTPIAGYYQCGSGTHPGGCVMGAPGRLAAGQILGDRRRAAGA